MNVLDLFSGIGGFSLGLERAGMRTIAFCEIDPFCRQVLRKHWPNVPCAENVETLDATAFGPVDVVCGGFPCQDISHASASKRLGLDGEKSGLWWAMLTAIEQAKPGWVVVENSYRGRRKWLNEAIRGLERLGFTCAPLEIAAHDIGANHERQRCFILADARGGRCWQAVETLRARRASSQLHPWWSRQPGIRRVDDGFSSRMDRLRKRVLGNAVVPQITELIGRSIIANA